MQRFLDGGAHDLLAERPLEGVDGHDAFESVILVELLEGGIDEGHLPEFILHSAVEEVFARFELLNDVGLIEPHGGEGIPVLRTEGFDHLAFAPIVDGGDAGHLARHEYHIVVISGFQRRTFGEVKIGARIEPHEVFHLVQPEFVEILFPFFSDGTEGR